MEKAEQTFSEQPDLHTLLITNGDQVLRWVESHRQSIQAEKAGEGLNAYRIDIQKVTIAENFKDSQLKCMEATAHVIRKRNISAIGTESETVGVPISIQEL